MVIQKFEDIVAWQKAKNLNIELRFAFKNISDFIFKDQLFRAALSITNNIAEGFDRNTDKEFKHFLHIARGSTAEVRSMLLLAPDLGYITLGQSENLSVKTVEISKIISGLINSLD